MHEALGGGVHVEPRLVLVLALTRLPHQICSLGRVGPGLGPGWGCYRSLTLTLVGQKCVSSGSSDRQSSMAQLQIDASDTPHIDLMISEFLVQ